MIPEVVQPTDLGDVAHIAKLTQSLHKGLALVYTAIPSTVNGNHRLGASGESALAGKTAEILGVLHTPNHIRAGEMMRHLGAVFGYRGKNFYNWRDQLNQKGAVWFDILVDWTVMVQVGRRAKQAVNNQQIVVVESKLLALQNHTREENPSIRLFHRTLFGQSPAIFPIGVEVDDDVANRRMSLRDQIPYAQVAESRALRFQKDQGLYHRAHPELPLYDPNILRQICYILVDNSAQKPDSEVPTHLESLAIGVLELMTTMLPETKKRFAQALPIGNLLPNNSYTVSV